MTKEDEWCGRTSREGKGRPKTEACSIVSTSSHCGRGEGEETSEVESGGGDEDRYWVRFGTLNYIRLDPLRHRW